RRHSFSERMDRVATFILGHPEAVAFGTTATVAEGAQVAPSTLVRFAQLLGLTGFVDMQRLVQAEVLKKASKSGEHRPSVGYRHTLGSIAEPSIRALESLVQSVTEEELCQFLDVVGSAETIFIVAERRSFSVALAFRHMLGGSRRRSFLATHDEFEAEDILALARPTDAIIEIDISSLQIGARKGRPHPAPSAGPSVVHPSASASNASYRLKLPEHGSAEIAALTLCQTIAACLMKAR
ncbi:MurR/RpiR family transcriptional regulator, partial [Devosia sp.]|uniref:MurR/RpiR family transcriptional regulator n=1 Tax=Devosia sp. TaxID=1871048 RepID=UPI002FCB0D09